MARPQNADRTNDLLFSIVIRRNDQRTAGIDEQFVLGTDEDLHTFALTRRRQQAQRILPCFQLVKQLPDGFQFLARLNVVQQIGLTAHDQHRIIAGLAIRPQTDTGLDKAA